MKRVVILLAACGSHAEPAATGPSPLDEQIALDAPPGVSDLTLDDRGHLWAIPERDRTIVEVELGATAKTTPHPLDGVPLGLDTEAMTWLGGNHFAIGTEGANAATASVRYADLGPDGHFAITRTRELTSAELGVELTINHGAEGICGKGDELLVGIESVGKLPDGTRWAPIVRLHGDTLSVSKLHLTSDRGKISALSCTFAADGTADVLAIERHYGVSRIIHFTAAPGAAEITPTVSIDLEPTVRDKFHDKLNLEGIVRLADGRWVLVNDNQGSRVEGPTLLFILHPR